MVLAFGELVFSKIVQGWLDSSTRRCPGEGNDNPFQYSSWRFHGQRSLAGYHPWGRKESDTTERLHFHVGLPIDQTVSVVFFSFAFSLPSSLTVFSSLDIPQRKRCPLYPGVCHFFPPESLTSLPLMLRISPHDSWLLYRI